MERKFRQYVQVGGFFNCPDRRCKSVGAMHENNWLDSRNILPIELKRHTMEWIWDIKRNICLEYFSTFGIQQWIDVVAIYREDQNRKEALGEVVRD